MCTAVAYRGKHIYFGRNLDLEYRYREQITLTPRHFPLLFRQGTKQQAHAAILGTATVAEGYPLYYDAMNEHGLSMAGLNFPGNARYFAAQQGKNNIAPFELIPWILSQCKTVGDAETLLTHTNIWDHPFSEQYPLSPLHWMIADRERSVVVESMEDGLHVRQNPVGVLTNNPPFPMQMTYLNHFMHLSPAAPVNSFAPLLPLAPYSLGMGAMGLPGDLSSPSRFVRAAFVLSNSPIDGDMSQFFHILSSVSQPRGCNRVREQEYEITLYGSCCDLDAGVYYLHTYGNRRLCAVDMHKADPDGNTLSCFDFPEDEDVLMLN